MSNRLSILIAAALLVLTTRSAWARFPAMNHREKSGNIEVVYKARLGNGPELKAGSYKVEVAENSPTPEVRFYQNGKVVARTQATLVPTAKKSGETEIYYDMAGNQHVITQIDLRGWDQKVMFQHSPSTNAKT